MDLAFVFYKVTNYCYYPDFKKPTVSISLGMNLDKWNSFDNEAKSIIEYAVSQKIKKCCLILCTKRLWL